MSASGDDLIDLLNRIPIFLYQSVGIILYIIGNIGNIVSIVILLKKSWRKNVCAFYFIICLICDLIYVNSAMIGAICINGFQIYLQNSNDLLCKIFFYISYVFATYLAIIFILASIDRLLISSQNVDTRLYSSRRLAYFSLTASFLIWSIFSLHSFIKVGIQEFSPTVFVCYYELSPTYMDFFSYSVLVISVFIPSIMVILSILAFKNVRRIRAIPRTQRKQVRSMSKKDFQLLRCLYLHNVVYVVSSILLSVSLVYSRTLRYSIPSLYHQALDKFLNNIGSLIHDIPYCTSFFIFLGLSKVFRQELKRWIYRIIGRDIDGIREEENQHVEGLENDNNDVDRHEVVISTVVLHQ